MAPRRPAAVQSPVAIHRLSADDLDVKLRDAGVPKHHRAACVRDINYQFDFYDRRLVRYNAPSEASQAESLRLVADAAKELINTLESLPPRLHLDLEQDYLAYLLSPTPTVERTDDQKEGEQAAADEALLRSITIADFLATEEVQPLAREVAAVAETPRADIEQINGDPCSRARPPPSSSLSLVALIVAAEKGRAEFERQVSRGRSKRRGTHWRDHLAWSLKVIAMAYSPKFKGNEGAAEDWVAELLDAVEIRCPYRETNPRGFRAMFTRTTY